MSLFSFSFGCFFVILALFYFLIPGKLQWCILLLGNLVFYAWAGPQYLIYIISCSFFTWLAARQINAVNTELRANVRNIENKDEKERYKKRAETKKRAWTAAALVLTIGVWVVLKYGRFLLDSVSGLIGIPEGEKLFAAFSPIVPLGMSFYTFDAVGYMLDVSRGKYQAEENFFRYLTFVSFFPHIIQGPFSRFDKLGKTLFAEHRFSYDRLCEGASRILWGYFKKLIIADKLAVTVNEIFGNYENYFGIHILFVMLLYGIQIYADFSGYIDIVTGISHIIGITLEENFRQPYFSVSVDEFWRRWHITLGLWFRDYLFFPISRSKRAARIRNRFPPAAAKFLVSFMAMFWVWSASGLWHGANWTFLIWGWLNMAIMLFSQTAEPVYKKMRTFFHISLQNKVWHCFRVIRTFCILCFLFFVTRVDSVKSAVRMLQWIRHDFNGGLLLQPYLLFPGTEKRFIPIILAAFLMMCAVDILCELGKWGSVKNKTHFLVRNAVYVILIVTMILFAGSGKDIAKDFIYANF